MFLVATKVAIVEALRAVWYENQNVGQDAHNPNPDLTPNDDPAPQRITIEYPEEMEDWPFILVQVRPTTVQWTGIMPDEVVNAADWDPDIDHSTDVDPEPPVAPQYRLIRQGRFEATCMLSIFATESQTRDRMWDNLTKLLLMGRKRSATNNFFTTLESHDLVGVTIMEGSIDAVGDTIGLGTPFSQELLTYEASIEFQMVGTFFADEFTEDLVPMRVAQVFEYVDFDGHSESNWRATRDTVTGEETGGPVPPFDADALGEWGTSWD